MQLVNTAMAGWRLHVWIGEQFIKDTRRQGYNVFTNYKLVDLRKHNTYLIFFIESIEDTVRSNNL